jgi:hypothetical protein
VFEDEDPETITSALKFYFREMSEPLLTFKLHQALMTAARASFVTLQYNCAFSCVLSTAGLPEGDQRRQALQACVAQLPTQNAQMLAIVIHHLKRFVFV